MKLLFFVLNDINKLDEFLAELTRQNLRGATILHSNGMARSLYDMHTSPMIDSLKVILEKTPPENRTIFAAVDETHEQIFRNTVQKVIGDLREPNTGILFTIPIDHVEGFDKLK